MSSRGPEAGLIESAETTASQLRGNMGVIELMFTVIAYNGPVVVFAGFIPVTILLGNGIGIPSMFIVCGCFIGLLALGLVTMASRLQRPGGFYALITAGVGRSVGLGAGFAALVCYFVALLDAYSFGGLSMKSVSTTLLHGPDLPWWAWSLMMVAIAAVLGFFNISFSARILTVFLMAELVLIIAYDISVLAKGGAHGISFESFTPHSFFSGSVAIAFLFGMGLFGGFEATVIFREEVRRPQRTIPVATYGVVALLTVLYAGSAWIFINSYGADAVMSTLNNNLAGATADSVKRYTGQFAYDLVTIMVVTSSFALILAAHNVTSRYLFNLGIDGVLPKRLGTAHPRHGAPSVASMTLTAATVLAIVVFVLARVDGEVLYARLAGVYSYAFLILLVLVALAIGVFLIRDRANGPAPVAAAAALFSCVVMCVALAIATKNFELLSGATGGAQLVLLAVIWGLFIAGVVLAAVLKKRRPAVYARIGRQ